MSIFCCTFAGGNKMFRLRVQRYYFFLIPPNFDPKKKLPTTPEIKKSKSCNMLNISTI